MTDPQSNDPVATDSPENPGGTAGGAGTQAPPAAEELPEVDDDAAATHAAELGDEAAQGDDHPYDKDADPDGEPRAVTGSAGTPTGSGSGRALLTTDADRPWVPSDPGAIDASER